MVVECDYPNGSRAWFFKMVLDYSYPNGKAWLSKMVVEYGYPNVCTNLWATLPITAYEDFTLGERHCEMLLVVMCD